MITRALTFDSSGGRNKGPAKLFLVVLLALLCAVPTAVAASEFAPYLLTSGYPLSRIGGSVTEFSAEGSALGTLGMEQLLTPSRLALDADGNLLVTDTLAGHVKRFDASGTFLNSLGDGHLVQPFGLAVGPTGNIFVGDRIQGDVRVFGPTGEFLGNFGGDVLLDAVEIKVSLTGMIFVGDMMAGTIRIFNAEEELFGSIRIPKAFPLTFALDEDGFLYVPGLDVVTKYDVSGNIVATIPTEGSHVVTSVEVDGGGNLVLLDYLSGQIRVYESDGTLLLEFGGDVYRYADDVLVAD